MNLLQRLLSRLDGLHYKQEYLCFPRESLNHPLQVYLSNDGQLTKDITDIHAFVGYKPLLFALEASIADTADISLTFIQPRQHQNEIYAEKDAIAKLVLQKTASLDSGHGLVNFYEGKSGYHRFISSFHQYIIGLQNRLFQQKPGNVFLARDLYTQVQIAYSLPRSISLITVGKDESYNCFPTDLHGAIGQNLYVVSLRHQGKACQQVIHSGRIVISQVESRFYKTVYGLGKNHMQELKSKEKFPFSERHSSHFNLPLPQEATRVRELELIDNINVGIHKLMLFRVVSDTASVSSATSLAHVHNVYATWRKNRQLGGNFLLR